MSDVAAFEEQCARIVASAKVIVADANSARRERDKVRVQLADALDAIHELKSQIVTKDNMIAELQELRAREGSR